MLTQYEVFIPTALAIFSLALFSDKTRILCYITVALSILAESVPMTVNITALVACIACLGALVITDIIHHNRYFMSYFPQHRSHHVTHHHAVHHNTHIK